MITMRNGTKYYRENELSKLGYIKKEELKDKIKEIKWDRDTTQDFDEVINKILELIK